MRGMSVALSVCLFSGLAFGQDTAKAEAPNEMQKEIERLRKIIIEEQQIIADCMKRIDSLEAAKNAQDKSGISSVVKFGGDFRYRYEYIHQDPENAMLRGVRDPFVGPDSPSTRERHRLRLRLGAAWNANEQWTLNARLASAMGADPVSTNQTLTDGFSMKHIWIETAYFDFHPSKVPGLNVYGGKMEQPFLMPGRTQMIWDHDLAPEGLAITYLKSDIPPWEFRTAVGCFQVQERSVDHDAQLFGVQGTVKYNLLEEGRASVLAGVSYYDFDDVEDYPPFFAGNDNFGNSLSLAVLSDQTNNGFFAEDYDIVEGFAEIVFPVRHIPFMLFGDYAVNTAAADDFFDEGDDNTAWCVGLQIGKCVAPRSWSARYEYRDVHRDAVVGMFNDSDFGGGGTNARGHVFNLDYMLFKNIRVSATYFLNHTEGSDWIRMLPRWGARENVDGPYERLQLDLNVKF